jgi:acetyl-CoA carboxylase carboxyl transferase subunit beta
MQEGTLALMQLVRTCAALARLADSGVPYISLMTDPTTGGVFASFAALGDINLAEPGALIGFAGTRVSAGTTGETLPDGFQRAEFLYQHGFVDRVVSRGELRNELSLLLRYLRPFERRRFPVAEAVAVGDPALAVAAGHTNGKVTGAAEWLPQRRESDLAVGASEAAER